MVGNSAQGHAESGDGPRSRTHRALIAAAIVLPLTFFWTACIHFLLDMPVTDDYDAVLHFIVNLKAHPALRARAVDILFSQHNEYKTVWANAVIAAQYALAGKVNFVTLSLIGDAQVMLLFWLLWKSFLPAAVDRFTRFAAFVPVALIALQLNYAETLNWPMPGLQNLGVAAFALLALYLLRTRHTLRFTGACLALVLAIAASGNGLFLFPVGLVLLLMRRRYRAAFAWTACTILCAAVYFTRYALVEPAGPRTLHPVFLLSLLGSFGGLVLPVARYGGVLFGCAVVLCLAWCLRRRLPQANPTMAGLCAFVLITLLAVSFTRGESGLAASLSSRYKIYADLLLVCLYSFAVTDALRWSRERQVRWYRWTVIASALFYVAGTAYGLRLMKQRYGGLIQDSNVWYATGGDPALAVEEGKDIPFARYYRRRIYKILHEAEQAGVYRMPRYLP